MGAFFNGELVALMTTKQFKNKIVVSKFHEKMGIGFNGNMFAKLLNSFELSLPVFYYPDRRYHSFKDEMLKDAGFTFEGGTEPELWYGENDNKKPLIPFGYVNRHNISEFVKNYDEAFTLYENMVLGGHFSIWDCGKLVFKKINK